MVIYDREKAKRMLRVALDVAEGAIDLAARPGGEPSLRAPVLEFEKRLRGFAAKGDLDAMYDAYLRILREGPDLGRILDRLHRKSFESEFYRFVAIYWERD
ncbi:MAG TPA: hypothetical protein VFG08_09170 [Candidatus Polarisedimenticolia bacterium]|nr:hypothetical protein [Candidatus Polarisedimenticolia bacterium]